MSLYNMLFGFNEFAQELIKILDINNEKYPIGRFRNIYIQDGKIILYTRNGGSNRKGYKYVFEALNNHPNYLKNYDDDFDCTYAYIEFSFPEKYKAELEELSKKEKTIPPNKAWNELFKALEKKVKEKQKK